MKSTDRKSTDRVSTFTVRLLKIRSGQLLSAAFVLIALAGGCSKSMGDSKNEHAKIIAQATSNPSTASLENTFWSLIETSGKPLPESTSRLREPHFQLDATTKSIMGNGGCNRFSGSYATIDNSLTLSELRMTKMACVHGAEVEREFFAALQRVTSWDIEGTLLTLKGEDGTALLRFIRVEAE